MSRLYKKREVVSPSAGIPDAVCFGAERAATTLAKSGQAWAAPHQSSCLTKQRDGAEVEG